MYAAFNAGTSACDLCPSNGIELRSSGITTSAMIQYRLIKPAKYQLNGSVRASPGSLVAVNFSCDVITHLVEHLDHVGHAQRSIARALELAQREPLTGRDLCTLDLAFFPVERAHVSHERLGDFGGNSSGLRSICMRSH